MAYDKAILEVKIIDEQKNNSIFRVEEGTELQAPVWFAVLFMLLVTSIFAGMFMKMEGWTFSKSLYFIFITFTTIGFGDIVPHNENVSSVTDFFINLVGALSTFNLRSFKIIYS